MKTSLTEIGHSKGIIIPSKLLKLIGFKERVHIEVQNHKKIIRPVQEKVREGWEDRIKEETERAGHPERLLPDFFDDEENADWNGKSVWSILGKT